MNVLAQNDHQILWNILCAYLVVTLCYLLSIESKLMQHVLVEGREVVVVRTAGVLRGGGEVAQEELENVPQPVHFDLGLRHQRVADQDGGVLGRTSGDPPPYSIRSLFLCTVNPIVTLDH